MTISEKVAYLKGLAEGLDLDTVKSKEGKLISVMIGIMEELAMSVEDLEENALNLGEEIDVLSDDLADVEAVLFDDEMDEDDEDFGLILLRVVEQDGEQLLADIDDEQELNEVYEQFMEELFADEEDGEE